MYAYPECLLSFFKTTSSSVGKVWRYTQASEEDGLCTRSATKAAARLVRGSGTAEQLPGKERPHKFGHRILLSIPDRCWLTPHLRQPLRACHAEGWPVTRLRPAAFLLAPDRRCSLWAGDCGQAAPRPSNKRGRTLYEGHSSLPEEEVVL